ALTGEVFALLRDHSILLRTGTGAGLHACDGDEGFIAGVKRSAHLPERLLGALFEVRTAQLLRERSGPWACGFLSGLLIGDELAGMSATRPAFRDVKIIGDAQLAALYQRAFAERAVAARIIDGSDCAIAGLQQLYESVPEEAP
ncbi:MAG: 2-dehydro-3-deoxygalactonokinase, partial [Steroidobacteraceae bacterium]